MTLTLGEPSAAHADLDERTESWRTAVAGRIAAADLRPTGRSQRAPTVDRRDLADLKITDCVLPDVEGVRTPRMADQDSDAVLVLTAFAGKQIFEAPQQTLVMGPGDLLVLSSRVSGRIVVPEGLSKRTVRIPQVALAPFDTGRTVPDCLLLSAGQNPLASLARAYLVAVGRQIDRMSPPEVEGARNAVLSLTAGVLRATQVVDIGSNDFLPLLRSQLEAWIVDHLGSGPIRVGDLASAHNVAPRTVNRAFAQAGDTVGSVIRRHRLAAARSDLVNLTSSVVTIALRWGFCDASHLRREFKREYSMSPSEYRDAYSVASAR